MILSLALFLTAFNLLTMQKIIPCLWFDGNAEEAINYYVSIFRNSKIAAINRYGESGPGPAGSVLMVSFELDGQKFTALNGGPQFKFTEAISFYVNCETQEEIDELWEKLSAGGQKQMCGWVKDKFGLSWQIIPSVLSKLMEGKNPVKSNNVMKAILTMNKLEIKKLKEAYDKE
jgi:predicted 3-demethylubiquinone-9 3-methyltransferase (glyoxalase superfamily)